MTLDPCQCLLPCICPICAVIGPMMGWLVSSVYHFSSFIPSQKAKAHSALSTVQHQHHFTLYSVIGPPEIFSDLLV